MNYLSPAFVFLFLPITMCVYMIFPKKFRWVSLLIASYIFFYIISSYVIAYLLFTTISVYTISNLMNKVDRHKLAICITGVLLQLGILIFLKYTNFFIGNMNIVRDWIGLPTLHRMKILVPIGISFYTLQAVSYLIDTYRGGIKEPKHLGKLALFLAFFPTVMEGPICRFHEISSTLMEGKSLQYHNITFGLQRVIWGIFKKVLIADRVNGVVNEVFQNYHHYSGIVVVMATCLYTIQLYTDFSGSIDVTIGIGQIFGITIPENFRQPFFARSATEFWKRWHITLGRWFKDYIFYPIALSKTMRRLKKRFNKRQHALLGKNIAVAIALFAVWFSNGLWHGPQWKYILYGMYFFIWISIEVMLEPTFNKMYARLGIRTNARWFSYFQIIRTVLFIILGELFFRATDVKAGFYMLTSIADISLQPLLDGSIFQLGMDRRDFFITCIAILIVFLVDVIHEGGYSIREGIARQYIVKRWTLYYIALFVIIIFGAYGVNYVPISMLYADF